MIRDVRISSSMQAMSSLPTHQLRLSVPTSARTISQYCNVLSIYLFNTDTAYLTTNYYCVHITTIECVSCTCAVPVSLSYNQ